MLSRYDQNYCNYRQNRFIEQFCRKCNILRNNLLELLQKPIKERSPENEVLFVNM